MVSWIIWILWMLVSFFLGGSSGGGGSTAGLPVTRAMISPISS